MFKTRKHSKISMWSLIFIIISFAFGFSNVVTGYNQMGYASVIWYIICSIVYLFPLAMIFAEYSGSLKKDHGGFYTWLINSVGEKWAFIGTFMWVGLFVINLLQNVSGLGIHFSGIVQGKDTSGSWHLGFLNSNQIEAVLGIIFIIGATFFATKGVRKIAITATIGGIASIVIIGLFIITSTIIMVMHGFHFAQPINGMQSFIKSPNPQFQSPIAIISFAVYAMFAYAGLEASSGFIDKLKNPRKTYPKVMIITAIIITSLYVFGIFICGFATNWNHVMNHPYVNLYNNGFYLMQNLGVGLAKGMGWSATTGRIIGLNFVRFLSFGALVPVIGSMIVLVYSPVKGLIAGSSKDLWPRKIAKFNRHDMPSKAMWIECGIIVIALIMISFTGNSGQQFYQIIVDMGNIGALCPYFFIVIAFIAFKKRKDIPHPIVFFHSMKSTYTVVSVVIVAMVIAAVMNLINPILTHQYTTAFWTFVGPIMFFGLSSFMYYLGIRHRAKRMIIDNETYKQQHDMNK